MTPARSIRSWLNGAGAIGVTAGASAPEDLVQELIGRLRALNDGIDVEVLDGIQENVQFKLPEELRDVAM